MNFQELLPRFLGSIPLIIGIVYFFRLYFKFSNRFSYMDYQGDSKRRFTDILRASIYVVLAGYCVLLAFMVFTVDSLKMFLLTIPVLLVLCLFVIPIGIVGSYFKDYQTKKLFGGFLPIVRARYGYGEITAAQQTVINTTKVKISRQTYLSAGLVSLLVFGGAFYFLSRLEWNGNPLVEMVIGFLMSGIDAFGVFMTIITSAMSRKLQALRDGTATDDDV